MSSVAFRLTVYQANGTTPDFTVSSIRGGTNPYIVGVPSGDGQEVDLLTGAVRSGAYNVSVADVVTGTDGTGTVRLITNKLEDASFRQQLLSRRAKIEISRNNGSTWAVWTFGYLTSLRQVDAITYNFTVSDSRRIEATHTAFTWSADTSAATDERREFPNRGCLIGGPTLQNFGPLRASGGWEYAWKEVQSGYLALAFVAAYNAPSYARSNTINVIGFHNALRPFFQSLPPIANLTGTNFEQIRERQYVFAFPKVMAIVTSGSSVWYGTVRAAHTPPAPGQNGQGMMESPTFGDMNYLYIELDPGQSTSYPSANARVRVQLLQKEVSASSPLYINEHPVDIATKLYETVNIPFNATSAAAIKAVVGDDIRLALRITEPVRMGEFLAQSIFGPFGFSARTNASGEQEFFATRITNSAVPSISITDDDVVGDTPPPVFEVDEASVVTSFRLTAKNLSPFVADPTGTLQAPPDGLVEVETSEIVQNGDTSTYSTREVAYEFPGMVHDGSVTGQSFTLSPEVVGRFFTSIVAEGFDRFGRGAVASEVQVLSGATAASLQVGDEVLLGIGYYPNKNYRIGESTVGSRIAQIVRRTETPEGPIFKLIDSGVNAQPTSPTFTLATFAGDPRRVAAVTVTNATTLNSSNVTLAVQYQVSSTTPTKTGTLFTRFRPGTIPTSAFTLPQVPPGSTVWVRMRTERTEYRASAWTNWTSVALDAWIPPVSLAVGTTTANSVALSWDLGSPTDNAIDPIDVFAYKGASAPADWTGYRVGSLSNSSTSITIRDLDASTQYTFGVAFKDEASGAYSTFATATATTNAVNTLTAPAAPKMKVYTSFPNAGTTTGVALAIGAVEGFNIVVERAPDSGGSPGTYKEIALLPPLTPIFVDPLPSDGLTRWYRIFYRLSGFLDGSKGPARSATPIAIPDDLVGQNASLISGGATLTFGSYLVGTPDAFYDGATSQSLAVDATSANTANKVVARDNTGSFSANTVTATLNGPAPAGQLTGTTLASNVVTSSLTSVGTIGTGVWEGTAVGKNYGGTGLTSTAFTGITNERVVIYDGGSGNYEILNSGSNGDALIYSGGALAWGTATVGSHVLADTTGLGSQHTTSGLTTGMILQATGASTARFQTPSIPASSVTAGTFSGASYTITNDLTVSGTLTASNPISGSITGNAATVTNGVYTTGSYADPSWITSLAGSKISGNISGNAANVTGTVAIANGGTNATSYGTSGSGTRAIVYDIGTNAFEAVSAGTSGQFLQSAGSAGDILWATPPNFNSTTAGYAPASGGGTSNFLRADGTWAVPSVGSVSANNVTAGTFSGANYYFTNNVRFDSGARVAFGNGYTIDNAGGSPISVLTATTLGSGVVNSSLTSVGTLNGVTIASGNNATLTAGDLALSSNAGYGILSADATRAIAITNASTTINDNLIVSTAGSSNTIVTNSAGYVGIGVVPSSYRLEVNGTIYTSSGGVRFPDGTTQTTAFTGTASVNANALVGTTLASNVVNSSLTSVGTSLSINGNTALHAGNYGSYSTFGGKVISGGNNGFANNVYYAGVRNPIWSFGNASSYGISYYQGAAGIGGVDTIGFSVNGTTSATSNNFAIAPGASYVNNNVILHAGNYTSYPIMHYPGGVFTGNFQDLTNTPGELRIDQVNNINGGSYSNQPPNVYTYGGVLSWRLVNHSFQLYASHTGDLTFKTQWDNDNYSGWRRILHEANYTSFAPSLTGSGASGTWGINVTGTAGSAPANGGTATALNGSNYISRTGTSGNYNTDFNNTPAGSVRHLGDDSNATNNPGGTWWFVDNYRHSNSSNYWGTQIAWGWEDNANRLAQRNVSGNSWSSWVYYLNSANYSNYALPLSGGTLTGGRPIELNTGGGYIALRADPGGWAMGTYYKGSGGTTLAGFGAYGGNDALTYAWIGPAYNSPWVTLNGSEVVSTSSLRSRKSQSDNNYTTAALWTESYNTTTTGIAFHISGIVGKFLEMRTNGTLYWGNNVVLDSANYSSYALPLSGGTVSGDLRITNRLGFTGSGNAGDGFPYARLIEAWGISYQSPDNRWTLSTSNSLLVGLISGGSNFGAGNVIATGNVTAYYSDERLKTNLGRIERALEKVRSLEGFRYVENELARSFGYTTKEPQLGVSAQAVQRIAPEVVSLAPFDMTGDGKVDGDGKIYSKSGENYLTVDYSRLVPLLIEAVKELADMVEELR